MTRHPGSNTEFPKTDRRILKSKKALRDALVELIQEKGFDAVSVEEITQRANLGRATFYLHYKDKEDLLMEEFSEMASERVQTLVQIPFSQWMPDENDPASAGNPPPLQILFEHVHENAELYGIFIRGKSAERLSTRMRSIIVSAINEFMQTKIKNEPVSFGSEVPVDFLAAFFSGAILSTVGWWLEQGLKPSPVEMTRRFQRLFFPGARNILGIEIK